MKIRTTVLFSFFILALPSQASATVVQTVDEPVTTEAGRWTHQVAEAGNYQIGLAWVDIKSGRRVDLRVLAGGKEIKSVSARPGPAPQRFETRVEGLAQGDSIEVEAIPAQGTRYLIGYQVAFCTPTFAQAKVFPVADFGARGDGSTDDMTAITRAVTAAKQAGGGIVRFDGSKTYRVIGKTDLTIEPVFDLDGARNIHIKGNGATLLIHPPDRMANIAFAENIHISGFTVDYDPKPYYQGTITNIDVDDMTIDIEVPDRYPVPEVGISPTHAPFFGRSFIPDAPGARSGHGDNLYIEEVTQIGSERQLRLQIRKDAKGSGTPSASMRPRVQHAFNEKAIEFVVPHRVYGHLGGNNIITRSSRIKLSDIRYYCAPYFWMSILSNTGPVTLSNVDMQTPHPETELYVTWRDGMHIKNGRWGILIEDGDWDGAAMYDDTFALYSRRQVLVSVTGKVATLTPSFQGRETFLWQPGDWASFWSPDQETLRGMARVVSAKDVTVPHYAVTLESVPAGVTPGDVVLHEESLNRNTIIRNCSTTNVGTESSTTRFRGTDVLFLNNRFEEFDLRLEFSDRLGTPRARDVVVEDTYINSVEGRVTLSRPLGVVFRRCTLDGVDVLCRHAAENIYFDNVAWTNMAGNILTLSQGSQAWLFGGTRRNGSASRLCEWIDRDAGSTVHCAAPHDYPAPNHQTKPIDPVTGRVADLVTPVMTDEAPAAGKRVRQIASEYKGTDVYHTLYLPVGWKAGSTYPVIVEYTGNRFPPGKGSGEVKDANLGYGMSGGRDFIWIVMPYVEKGLKKNAVTWWGDRQATVDYCKVNLPRICKQFGGDLDKVFICGFSRGAIGSSYIGLADDEIAMLWKGMFTHDHFDGHKQWGYPESDRASALTRLARLKGRPVLICGQRAGNVRDDYLMDHLDLARFTFLDVPTTNIFKIPEGPYIHAHTDLWMHRESEHRRQARVWLQNVLKENRR